MQYHFSGFIFDADTFELSSAAGEAIALQPRALELLYFLLRQPRALARKEDILREVWGGVSVSSGALSLQVFKLREALGDTETPHQMLQTIKRQGLRLNADVSALGTDPDKDLDRTPVALAEPSERVGLKTDILGGQPTIAVLEFLQNDVGHELSGLTRALPTDIIAALSRLRLLRVSSRASSFLLDSTTITGQLARSALGVDYCLMGSLNRTGAGYTIFAELIRTDSDAIIWAEQFEVGPDNWHELRSEIVNQVVTKIERRIPDYEARSLKFKQPESLTAWQAYHVGTAIADRRGASNMPHARRYFERAVNIDPTFSRAWSGIARTHFIEAISAPSDVREPAVNGLVRASEQALLTDNDDPEASLNYGLARSAESNHEKSKIWFEQAIDIAPSYALAYQELGTQQLFAGNPEIAFEHSSAAVALNPQSPVRFNIYRDMAIAKQSMGDLEASIEWGCKAGQAPFDQVQNLVVGLCCNHIKGNTKTAESLAARIKGTFPDFAWERVYGTNMMGDAGKGMVEAILAQYNI